MKKLLLFYVLLSSILVNAQITITSDDMPSPGDTIRTSIGINTDSFDFAATGENFLWDFRALNPMVQRVDTFLSVTETPIAFWPFFIGSANLVAPFNPSQLFQGLPDAEAFRFLNNSASSFKDVGYGVLLDGTPLPLKFSQADEIYQFPMTYGQSFTSAANLEIGVPDFGYILVDRNRQNEIDGWGTLSTPYGTFEVLRYKSVVSEYDSVYIESNGQATALQRDYVEYHWLANQSGLPLLQVQIDAVLGNTAVYVDSARVVNVGASEFQYRKERLSVYPNPSTDFFTFKLSSESTQKATWSIFDLNGRCLVPDQDILLQAGENMVTIQVGETNLIPGSYLLLVREKSLIRRVVLVIGE